MRYLKRDSCAGEIRCEMMRRLALMHFKLVSTPSYMSMEILTSMVSNLALILSKLATSTLIGTGSVRMLSFTDVQ